MQINCCNKLKIVKRVSGEEKKKVQQHSSESRDDEGWREREKNN